jgi:YidC/Oxa1 family membrane protein insertase
MGIINDFFTLFLDKLYLLTGDWGLAIAAITFVVRLVLIPFSFKQKVNMGKQQVLSKKMEEIKERYKNDKQKKEQELSKLSAESAKTMLGCLVTLLQIPVMISLYNAFRSMEADAGSILVPWISSLKLADGLYIIPVISSVVQLLPNILTALGVLKNMNLPKPTKGQYIITVAFNLLFLAKAPVSIGIYWISTGFFSLFEQVMFNIYNKRRGCRQVML